MMRLTYAWKKKESFWSDRRLPLTAPSTRRLRTWQSGRFGVVAMRVTRDPVVPLDKELGQELWIAPDDLAMSVEDS